MTGIPGMTKPTQAIARRLAGVGTRPSATLPVLPAAVRDVPFVIVGGGASGVQAARETTGPGLLLEARPGLGGRALDGFGPVPDTNLDGRLERMLGTRAVGLFEEGGDRWVLALGPEGLVRIRTREVHLATGGVDVTLPFGGNDLPGIVAGRPLARLVEDRGLFAGARVVVVASHPDALVVARRLRAAGLALEAVVDTLGTLDDESLPIVHAQVVDAGGRSRVRHLVVRGEDGVELKLACNVVGVVAPLAPAYELAAEVGAEARFSAAAGGFVLVVDDHSRTTVPWVHAHGRVAGRP
jgi:sarcosine oxidase subunit alpha